MKTLPRLAALLVFFLSTALGGAFEPRPDSSPAEVVPAPAVQRDTDSTRPAAPLAARNSLLRVNSMNQAYDFFQPWRKKNPAGRRGIGVVIPGGRILVTAELVANSNFIELEKAATAEKSSASVERVDYDCNLAILRPSDPAFLAGMTPFPFDGKTSIGDSATILQFEPNGEIAETTGRISSIAVSPYPLENLGLLVFKLSAPLQQRDGSFTLPAVRDGRLLGLVMRYDARNQIADIIPMPVVKRFLGQAAGRTYRGFPRLGVSYSPLRDPQLRRYIGLKEPGGIYITKVTPGGSAAKAGLLPGDVLLAIDGKPLDQDGNHQDPDHGRILFSHLTNTATAAGDKITLKIFRQGKTRDLVATMEPPDRSRVVSPAFLADTAPPFVILGGLVFIELSRPFLQEWGMDWVKSAPRRLVHLDAFQDELPEDRGKIVVLARVLPTPDTIGYDNLGNLVVKELNGRPVKSLADLSAAARHPIDGFQKIELEEDPKHIFLDAASVEANRAALMEHYDLPALERLPK